MRISIGCVACLVLASTTQQDSIELRARYGEPNLERFAIRPEMTMAAEYGADGKACVLYIEPRQAFIHQLYFPVPTISDETMQNILNEVVPPEIRGNGSKYNGFWGSIQFSRQAVKLYRYDNLTIFLSIDASPTEGGVKGAAVRFTRPVCGNETEPVTFSKEQSATGSDASPGWLSLAGVMPETSAEFHARYGKPDVEQFIVRPDLTLTVEYCSDGEACRMRIQSRHKTTFISESDSGAPMDEVLAVLNEVVPPGVRGNPTGFAEQIWNSCYGSLPPTEYENVTVIPYYGICQRPLVDRGVEVLFKRPVCKSLPKYAETRPNR